MFEKGSKFGNPLSEQTDPKFCQNSLPTVLRNQRVIRGLAQGIRATGFKCAQGNQHCA